MTWKLWLDDQCNEIASRKAPDGFIACESVIEAQRFVNVLGLPGFMDLDHDLGEKTALDFLKWLVEKFPDGPVPEYKIHSENPIGKQNIRSYLENWRKYL
jgi:hypothetical protein